LGTRRPLASLNDGGKQPRGEGPTLAFFRWNLRRDDRISDWAQFLESEEPVMVRGRLAVLGLCGVVLSVMVAGAMRIHSLEERVASLEKVPQGRIPIAAATPVSTLPQDLTWAPEGSGAATLQLPGSNGLVTSPLPNGAQLPNGTTAHDINGMTYYVIPLADGGGAASRR